MLPRPAGRTNPAPLESAKAETVTAQILYDLKHYCVLLLLESWATPAGGDKAPLELPAEEGGEKGEGK